MTRPFQLLEPVHFTPGCVRDIPCPSLAARYRIDASPRLDRIAAELLQIHPALTPPPEPTTPLAAVAHWHLALQREAGLLPAPCLPVVHDSTLVIPTFFPGRPLVRALRWLTAVANAAHGGHDTKELRGNLSALLGTMRALGPRERNIRHFLAAAQELDLPVTRVVDDFFRYGQGSRSRVLFGSFTDDTAVVAARLARDKIWTGTVLQQHGLPVPRQIPVFDREGALLAAQRLGFPVVVKPADLDGGAGVAAGLICADEVSAAFGQASRLSRSIVVEEHFEARDYRLTVFQGELIWATERVPATLEGDGRSTVAELLDAFNQDPLRGADERTPLQLVPMDDEARRLLERAGLTEASVLAQGQRLPLRRFANVLAGATPVAVYERVHPDNRLLAIRAAAALGLDLAGVDVLCPDIERSWREVGGLICEVNAQPGLGSVTSTRMYAHILERLVPGDGRIATAVLVGRADVEQICQELQARGLRAGYACAEGAVLCGEWLTEGPMAPFAAARVLLANRAVDVVLLCLNDGSWEATGLPFDRFDVLARGDESLAELLGQRPGVVEAHDRATIARELETAFRRHSQR